ncbi:MAG: hypothetical protein CVU11_14955 [Bacteroidetes bacterium HGW-Bacteroidetes-6]|jgi:hypothetical protein|nr:MAG: hypothetical protein CVU11_14955 [Bacteroidetes bacterium HGW-Bacteroidetes-6]
MFSPLVKIKHLYFVVLSLMTASSCAQPDNLHYQILQMCIDTAANKNEPYFVDFSDATFWTNEEKDSLFQENPLFEPGNTDSIMKYDKQWIEYEVLSKKIIFFRGVTNPVPGRFIITLDHLWSSDGSHGLEIIIIIKDGKPEFEKVDITWIS